MQNAKILGMINNGEKATVWHPGNRKECSPIIIKNSLGICFILPFSYDENKHDITIIEEV